jgi:radical SAM modification target selenobiotic family peptide
MGEKHLKQLLAGLGLAGLVAGAGVATPGSAFGSSG